MMINLFIISVSINLILGLFFIYTYLWVPNKYMRFIIIDESAGAEQIKIDWGRKLPSGHIQLLKSKMKLKLDEESAKDEEGRHRSIRFIDKKGKPLYIIRYRNGLVSYCYYDSEKKEIIGLTKDQRLFFADEIERIERQYTLDSALGRFLDKNGQLMIFGFILIMTIVILLKFGSEPSNKLVMTLKDSIGSLTQAVSTFQKNLGNSPAI